MGKIVLHYRMQYLDKSMPLPPSPHPLQLYLQPIKGVHAKVKNISPVPYGQNSFTLQNAIFG